MLEITLTGVVDEAIVEELTKTTQRFRGKLEEVTLIEVNENEPKRGKA
jgi:hypothetical protein